MIFSLHRELALRQTHLRHGEIKMLNTCTHSYTILSLQGFFFGRRGRNHMAAGFKTTYAISAYHH